MNFAFFASLIVFCIWLAYEIRKHNKKNKKSTEAFWQKEALADSARKQSLDNLDYIVLPPEILHLLDAEFPDSLQESVNFLKNSTERKIVNLSFITNTDLKLRYGAANLETLTDYDLNFTALIKHLNTVGEFFYTEGDSDKAETVLEYAVSVQSDLISTYRMLADLYVSQNNASGLDYLINTASLLPGLTKGPILRLLHDLRPEDTNEPENILDILD